MPIELSYGLLSGLLGLLLASCFVKIFTTLTILRAGLGLWQWEFGVPVFILALCLSAFVMEPYVSLSDYSVWSLNLQGGNLQSGNLQSGNLQSARIEAKLTPFLRSFSDPSVYSKLRDFRQQQVSKLQVENQAVEEKLSEQPESGFLTLLASFVVSQLKEAFSLGLFVLVPFLVVDLLIVNLLMVLGVKQFSPEVIAVPLKLLLFFSVDGWTLLSDKLLRSYL